MACHALPITDVRATYASACATLCNTVQQLAHDKGLHERRGAEGVDIRAEMR